MTRHNYHPAEGYPQTPKGRSNRRVASLTPLTKQVINTVKTFEENKAKYREKLMVGFRVTSQEKTRLEERAEICGLTVSEYLRRRFFGGRPIVAHMDEAMIRELKRIGGLLKHNFETLRNADAPENIFELQEELLWRLKLAIEKIGAACHGRQKD